MLTESITGYERFSIPISDIPDDVLYKVAEGRGLDGRYLPDGTRVDYWEIESTLESLDERRDHKRALDAAVQGAIELYDDRSYDLILTNIDYDISRHADETEFGTARTDKWYRGEIDLMLVDIDENWVRAVEVKPQRGLPRDHNGNPILEAPTHQQKVQEQYQRQSFAFDVLNEKEDGFQMHYTPEDGVFEPDLKPELEIPDEWTGQNYWTEEAMEKGFESESFRSFLKHFVLPENPMAMSSGRALVREKREEGDFIKEFLDGREGF